MRTGIAFSGGGARAVAHLGVVKALKEHGLIIDTFSGTSAGALVGAFLAGGYEPEEVLKILLKTNVYKILRPAISMRGLLKCVSIEPLIKPYFTHDSFESLDHPLYVSATNIRTGKIKFFSKGELIKPLLASCSIPVVFEPLQIDGDHYMDGGIINNLPVEPFQGNTDRIIGVHCNPISNTFTGTSMKRIIERSLLLAINENVSDRKPACDLFVEPTPLKDFRVFDFKKAKEMYDVGYRYTVHLLSNASVLSRVKSILT